MVDVLCSDPVMPLPVKLAAVAQLGMGFGAWAAGCGCEAEWACYKEETSSFVVKPDIVNAAG